MADVRCPMCGKNTPADQAVCQFCGARLRPVWESGEDQAAGSNLPDWLTGLDGAAGQPSQPDENVPDWLSGLRGEAGSEAEPPPPARPEEARPQDSDADASGWLKNILDDSSFAGEEESSARPLDELPEDSGDWLSRIGATGETPAPSGEEPGAGRWDFAGQAEDAETPAWPEEGETELPDWLRSAPQASSQPPAGAAGEPLDWGAAGGEQTPDWLKDMADEPAAEEPAAPVEDELPDWLRSGAEPEAPASETGGASGFATPDWLKDMAAEPGEPSAAEPAGESEPADWMAAAGGDELPDWLTSASAEPPAAPAQPAAPDFSTPDWLKGMDAEPGEPAAAEPGGAANWASPPGGDELPDWLKYDSQEPAEAAQPQNEPPEFATPDWLNEISSEGAVPAEPAAPAAGDELPAWLSAASGPGEVSEAEGGAQEFAAPDWLSAAETAPGEAQPAGEENGMLSWLAAMESETAEPSPASGMAEEAPATGDLSWLDELESTYSGLSVESNQPSSDLDALNISANVEEGSQIEQGSLPAWLMGTGLEEEAQPEAGQGQEDDSLKVEALPSWLQAMRPVGAPSAIETEPAGEGSPQPVEGAGPLAGLRGVLPAEPDISQVGKPPVYSVRLQVTEAQEVQAKMLADLLEAEVQPRAVPESPILTSRTLLRVVVALALILALLTPILTGLPAFSPPAIPGDVSSVYNLIDTIPAGARVLLAVDYDPSFSAEMDAVTTAALVHLLNRGAIPVMVSTTGTGPMQAERLIGMAGATASRPLIVAQDYVNIGYIPGGTAGLASFVQSPINVQTIDLLGQSPPNIDALIGVNSLVDFRLVLVATESPDRARAWIEQIQSQAVSTPIPPPLVMLVSAQAEPLVRPYYNANPQQVQGLVTGLSGALAYETLSGQSGPAAQLWSPFNLGLAAAALLMLLGSLFNLIARRLPAKRGPQEGKPA